MKNQSILSMISMTTKKTASKVGIIGLTASIAMLAQTSNAADNVSTIPLDMSGVSVTKHEIAVMQVLSEICPPMLKGKQKQRFYKSYNYHLHELMPSLDDPKAAIQYLSTQQDYRQILQSIRSWTLGFSKQENRALCVDLADAEF